MITLDDARAHVLGSIEVGPVVERALLEAVGCALAADATAVDPVPPFANSSVDGYAIQAVDTDHLPARLEVIDTVAAGYVTPHTVEAGRAIRIMTGAPVPVGADAVVMQEHTERDGATVVVHETVEVGRNVRPAGSDVERGQTVIAAGTELRPAHLGVLATIGRRTVEVHRPARVGVLSTGDELVVDAGPLGPGKIHESNRDMLLALAHQANATTIDLGVVPDDPHALMAVIQDATASCDVIVSSGGVSVGEHDVVRAVLADDVVRTVLADGQRPELPDRWMQVAGEEPSGQVRWMQIAIRPGKPFVYGRLGPVARPVHYFGLAGNPVSAMVGFELLVRPALRRLMGHVHLDRPSVRATADRALPASHDGRTHYVRVRATFEADGRLHVAPTGGQGSHMLTASAASNALAVVPPDDDLPAGSELDILLLAPAHGTDTSHPHDR